MSETWFVGIAIAIITVVGSAYGARWSGRNERQRIGQEFAQIMGTERQRIAAELDAARARERDRDTKDTERNTHVDSLRDKINQLREELSDNRIGADEREAQLRADVRTALSRIVQLEAALRAVGANVPPA